MRSLNVRLIIIVAAVMIVSGLTLFGIHWWQMPRHAQFYWDQGEAARKLAEEAKARADAAKTQRERDDELKIYRENYIDALRKYTAYINLKKDDAEALEKRGLYEFQLAEEEHTGALYNAAFTTLEQVLRLDADREESRKKLVKVATTLGRYPDALVHLQALTPPGQTLDDPELLDLLGQCHLQTDNLEDAQEAFRESIKLAPQRVAPYSILARLLWTPRLRNAETEKEAEALMDALIQANPESAEAYLARGQYRLAVSQTETSELEDIAREMLLDEAEADVAKSLELEADGADALLLAARCRMVKARQCLLQEGVEEAEKSRQHDEQMNEARTLVRRGINAHPRAMRMYAFATEIERQAGDREAVLAVLKEGLLATDQHPELLWWLANSLLDGKTEVETAEAMKIAEKFSNIPELAYRAAYLQARLDYQQGRWRRAADDGFELCRGYFAQKPQDRYWLKLADYWLARCYEELGNIDGARHAAERVLTMDPSFQPALRLVARLQGGRGGDLIDLVAAAKAYRKNDQEPPAGWLPYTQNLVRETMRLPKEKRDWALVEYFLDKAQQNDDTGSYLVVLLRADVLSAQGRAQDAENLILRGANENADNAAYWSALVNLASNHGDWAKAKKYVNQTYTELGNEVQARIIEAQYLTSRYRGLPEGATELKRLIENVEQFSEKERAALYKGLMKASLRVTNDEASRVFCKLVAESDPDDIESRFALFEIAGRDRNPTEMAAALEDVRKVDGENANWYYGRASLASVGKNPTIDSLQEAIDLLEQADNLRPSWSKVPLLRGVLLDQQAGLLAKDKQEESAQIKLQAALQNYRKAIDLGETNPPMLRRVANLLASQGQLKEAGQILQRLGARSSEVDLRQQRDIHLRGGDVESALKAAEQVATTSETMTDHLVLGELRRQVGHMRAAARQGEEAAKLLTGAETALRKAVSLAKTPDEIAQSWTSLFNMLTLYKDKSKAQTALAQVKKEVPADKLDFVLASCYAALQQNDDALRHCRKALDAAPNDVRVVRFAARLYQAVGDTDESKKFLTRILEDKSLDTKLGDRLWARRMQALRLARGNSMDRRAAMKLIEQNLAEVPNSAQDKRIKAELQKADAAGGSPGDVIKTLEELVGLQQGTAATPNPEDEFALASAYYDAGQWLKAHEQMTSLLGKYKDNPALRQQYGRWLLAYAGWLVERRDWPNASRQITELKRIMPNAPAVVNLESLLLFGRKQYGPVVELLREYTKRSGTNAREKMVSLANAANQCELLANKASREGADAVAKGFIQEATNMWSRCVREAKGPEILFASFYARQGQIDNALLIIERVWKTTPQANSIMQALFEVMTNPAASPQHVARADKVLAEALIQHGRPADMLSLAAEIRTYQGNYDEAEKLNEEAIKKDSKSIMALNNLAVLLATRGIKLDRADQCIEAALRAVDELRLSDALRYADNRRALLDSRATVRLAQGRHEEALADSQKAVANKASGIRCFHLALAYDALGQTREASGALERAESLGLDAEKLPPLERDSYAKLRAKVLPN